MVAGSFRCIDRFARLLSPFVISAALVLFAALPVQIPGYGQIAFNVGLMTVFYWAIYRPDLMPAVAAFSLGLWQDILVGSPVGLNALILLLANWAIVSQRTFFQGKSFGVIWFCFALVTIVAAFLAWIIVCGLNASLIDPSPGLFQGVFTIGVFPFTAWLLARLQHALLRPVDVSE